MADAWKRSAAKTLLVRDLRDGTLSLSGREMPSKMVFLTRTDFVDSGTVKLMEFSCVEDRFSHSYLVAAIHRSKSLQHRIRVSGDAKDFWMRPN